MSRNSKNSKLFNTSYKDEILPVSSVNVGHESKTEFLLIMNLK